MKKFGFTRSVRLMDSSDFKRLFETGKRASGKSFTVLYYPNNLAHGRLGLALPRKHFSRAVDKNRIKRLIRESFRHWQGTIGGYDLVVLSKSGVSRRPNSDLQRCLELQWLCLIQQCGHS